MRVIFRISKQGEVTAWLPDVPARLGYAAYYTHVGGHGEGYYQYHGVNERLATPTEYADLLTELRQTYSPKPIIPGKRFNIIRAL